MPRQADQGAVTTEEDDEEDAFDRDEDGDGLEDDDDEDDEDDVTDERDSGEGTSNIAMTTTTTTTTESVEEVVRGKNKPWIERDDYLFVCFSPRICGEVSKVEKMCVCLNILCKHTQCV